MTTWNRKHLALTALLVATFLVLYWPVGRILVRDWVEDDNSHGFMIVPLALFFVWERRRNLALLRVRHSWTGLLLVAGSLLLLFAGVLGAETFPARLSIVTLAAGAVLFILGPDYFKALLFPLGFLLLMIPLPKLVFNEVAFPLQLLASNAAVACLKLVGIPVLREGNVIVLANTSFEVAEACSGIRSLMSLFTLSLVYGYFTDNRRLIRLVYALMSIPVAIGANALRVAGTGGLSHWLGPEAAQGFFHTFSGWLVFVAAFAMLLVLQFIVLRIAPPPSARGGETPR